MNIFKNVAIKGKHYSLEYNQSFETQCSICSIKEDKRGNFNFKIDGISQHVNCFRKQCTSLEISKQRHNRGINTNQKETISK